MRAGWGQRPAASVNNGVNNGAVESCRVRGRRLGRPLARRPDTTRERGVWPIGRNLLPPKGSPRLELGRMVAPPLQSLEVDPPVEDPRGLGGLGAPTALIEIDRLDARE
eukprot:4585492-Lingulodinium_polyedra.AAC.1